MSTITHTLLLQPSASAWNSFTSRRSCGAKLLIFGSIDKLPEFADISNALHTFAIYEQSWGCIDFIIGSKIYVAQDKAEGHLVIQTALELLNIKRFGAFRELQQLLVDVLGPCFTSTKQLAAFNLC